MAEATAIAPQMLIPQGPPQSTETLGPTTPIVTAPQFHSMEPPPPSGPMGILPPIAYKASQGDTRDYGDPTSFDVIKVPKPVPKIPGGMKFMATLALFMNKDVGPIMALKQQERKMAAFDSLIPIVQEVNSLASKGKHEQAKKLLTEGTIGAIGIAPEIQQFIQPMLEKVYASEKATQYADRVIADLEVRKADAMGNPQKLAHIGALLKSAKIYRDSATVADFEAQMKRFDKSFHLNTSNQTMTITDVTGDVEQISLPQKFDNAIFKTAGGMRLAAQLNMTPEEMGNVANGHPVMRGEVNITPQMQPIVQAAIRSALGTESARQFAKDAPWTPEYNAVAQKVLTAQGVDPDIAGMYVATHGASGLPQNVNMNPKQFNDAVLAQMRTERIELDKAAFEVKNQVPMSSVPEHANKIVLGGDKKSDTFLLEKEGLSYNEALKMQKDGTARIMNRTLYNENVVPAMSALDALNQVGSMFQSADYPETTVRRVLGGILRTWTRATGSANEEEAKVEAASVIISRAAEAALKTQTIKTEDAAIIKRLITKPFATRTAALAAAEELKGVLDRSIDRYSNTNSLSTQGPTTTIKGLGQAGEAKGQVPAGALQLATEVGLNPHIVIAIASNEGSDDQGVGPLSGGKKAYGRWQVTVDTAKTYGFTEKQIQDPETNQNVAFRYLADLSLPGGRHYDRTLGTLEGVIGGYFGGPGAVENGKLINPGKSDGNMTRREYVDRAIAKVQQLQGAEALNAQRGAAPTQRTTQAPAVPLTPAVQQATPAPVAQQPTGTTPQARQPVTLSTGGTMHFDKAR